jgi:hypothetical protein
MRAENLIIADPKQGQTTFPRQVDAQREHRGVHFSSPRIVNKS